MKWCIPAKTFLLGEYAALTGAPAIILTTTPCFELTLVNQEGLPGIHPASPAGRLWSSFGYKGLGLHWTDPYQGCGGMGASSAQFLGAYFAIMHLQKKIPHPQVMLDAYLKSAWTGEGVPPSGYDVLAQALQGCVYIDRQHASCYTYNWPFADIDFFLLHTGRKLATHHHLQRIKAPQQVASLSAIVNKAQKAFEQVDSCSLSDAVNAYHRQLATMDLVAEHSLQHIASLKEHPDILAVKGCGALGADVLLLIVPTAAKAAISHYLREKNWKIMATSADLYVEEGLFANNSNKGLEISHLSGIIPPSLGR